MILFKHMQSIFFVMCITLICGCSREEILPISANGFDKTKLVDKDWFWGRKSIPQLLTVRFQSNDTSLLTQCININPPYTYVTDKTPWVRVGKDTIAFGGRRIKIFSVNDSVLITNNWVVAGGGLSDTIKVTFRNN